MAWQGKQYTRDKQHNILWRFQTFDLDLFLVFFIQIYNSVSLEYLDKIYFVAASPYRELISNVILKLQEEQKIHALYEKWWKGKNAGNCMKDAESKDTTALGVANVSGVFVVLAGGLVVGFLISLLEFMWKAKSNAKKDKVCINVIYCTGY
jgi:hypothetical protein